MKKCPYLTGNGACFAVFRVAIADKCLNSRFEYIFPYRMSDMDLVISALPTRKVFCYVQMTGLHWLQSCLRCGSRFLSHHSGKPFIQLIAGHGPNQTNWFICSVIQPGDHRISCFYTSTKKQRTGQGGCFPGQHPTIIVVRIRVPHFREKKVPPSWTALGNQRGHLPRRLNSGWEFEGRRSRYQQAYDVNHGKAVLTLVL